eukprot:CAMPEP_0175099826 /NCGR_PEP_ID=MMETSP0086_2-20121207/6688_1 /TAXON_ID=136419 /ORGANISM="Unknown Unknown, Strain D1" /LENGTH=651 /DNA_ID=CAMNT_0016373751 /DNA_START=63 /DNA_END=2018 /DNA_ORIENTATION=+
MDFGTGDKIPSLNVVDVDCVIGNHKGGPAASIDAMSFYSLFHEEPAIPSFPPSQTGSVEPRSVEPQHQPFSIEPQSFSGSVHQTFSAEPQSLSGSVHQTFSAEPQSLSGSVSPLFSSSNVSGNRSSSPSSSQNSRYKIRRCKHFSRGHCDRGEECSFVHDGFSKLNDALQNLANQLQPEQKQQQLQQNDFQHSRDKKVADADQAAITVSGYKTRMCKHFVRGHCEKGAECTFKHGEVESSLAPPSTTTKVEHTPFRRNFPQVSPDNDSEALADVPSGYATWKRPKLCKHYAKGHCGQGSHCGFWHGSTQGPAQGLLPESNSPGSTISFEGSALNQSKSRSKPSRANVTGLNMSRYKTRLCKHYARGHCEQGSHCGFWHGEGDATRTPKWNAKPEKAHCGTLAEKNLPFNGAALNLRKFKTKVCKHNLKGNCNKGASCSFLHSLPELQPSSSAPSAAPNLASSGNLALQPAQQIQHLQQLLNQQQLKQQLLQQQLALQQTATFPQTVLQPQQPLSVQQVEQLLTQQMLHEHRQRLLLQQRGFLLQQLQQNQQLQQQRQVQLSENHNQHQEFMALGKTSFDVMSDSLVQVSAQLKSMSSVPQSVQTPSVQHVETTDLPRQAEKAPPLQSQGFEEGNINSPYIPSFFSSMSLGE